MGVRPERFPRVLARRARRIRFLSLHPSFLMVYEACSWVGMFSVNL
jgi:hypothetical protein